MRIVQTLKESDIIEDRLVTLDESQAENFGGGFRTVLLLLLKDFRGEADVETRMEEYVNSYVHVKTVYKRKEIDNASSFVNVDDDADDELRDLNNDCDNDDGGDSGKAKALDFDLLLAAASSADNNKQTSSGKRKRVPLNQRVKRHCPEECVDVDSFLVPSVGDDGANLELMSFQSPVASSRKPPRVIFSKNVLNDMVQTIEAENEIDTDDAFVSKDHHCVEVVHIPNKIEGNVMFGSGWRDPWTLEEVLLIYL
jgi:hypothetical protein